MLLKIFKYKLIIIFLMLISCSSSETNNENKELKLSVEILKLDAWLNLMPGGPGSFHIAGEINILSEDEINLAFLKLNEIIVYQDQEIIYKILPDFKVLKSINKLDPGEKGLFTFQNKENLKIKSELQADKTIDIKLLFDYKSKTVEQKINDISIEKTY